ncbi:MAG: hypothetical protein V4549_06460 [Bacteroidota bacterium]
MIIPKETLDAIREELPHGAQMDIAKEAGYTDEYVNMVLRASKPITDSNKVIITIAQRIIREKRAEEEAIKKDIENTIRK